MNGEQRRAAAAKQVCKGADNDDQRKAKPDRAQRSGADLRNAGNINTFHNVVQQVENLRHQHGQCRTQNILRDVSAFKINAFHLFGRILFCFLEVSYTMPNVPDSTYRAVS